MKGDGSSIVRRPTTEKSNVELINSLRSNFVASQQAHSIINGTTTTTQQQQPPASTSSASNGSGQPAYLSWTSEGDDALYIPSIDPSQPGLAEERAQYDITVKLFYLPGIPVSRRCAYSKQAIDSVLKELHVDSVDLLIVSFPGLSFDADDEGDEELSETKSDGGSGNNGSGCEGDEGEGPADDFESIIQTWRTMETFQEKGMIGQLGVAEFSSERLARLLPHTRVKPSVDQINVKDCCIVPKSLILYAKQQDIQLLTHNDCTDILPVGTTRELLGPREKNGAGILASAPDADDGIKGDVEPQWVVKYTAVIKDRGVVENKGYFALANIGNCVQPQS